METRIRNNARNHNAWIVVVLVLVLGILLLTLTNPGMVEAWAKSVKTFGANGIRKAPPPAIIKIPRPMPVVEDYYAKGWDFRARNVEEQVIVITDANETFGKKLFKIGSAINLCAHMGHAPPLILVDSGRVTDARIPENHRDIPELIQDLFPKLRVLSIPDPQLFVDEFFPNATHVRGKMKRTSTDVSDFIEFPTLDSSTIVISGSWESWEYVDDYRTSLFEQLEFHPVIYHYCRKTYPSFFDRRTPARGVFLGNVNSLYHSAEEINRFVSRSQGSNEKIILFLPESQQPLTDEALNNVLGDTDKVVVVVGECEQIQIYLGVFCRELLIDLTDLGWWVGFHALHRGRHVHRVTSEEAIPLMSHYSHPSFLALP